MEKDTANLINKLYLTYKSGGAFQMAEKIELATMSARGQVCIPTGIREDMGLETGTKVLFCLSDDTLIMKKVTAGTFAAITKPLKEEAKKAGLKEADVARIVHRARKS